MNTKILFIFGLILSLSGASCSGGAMKKAIADDEARPANLPGNSSTVAPKPPTECPAAPVSVNETKNLEKYDGCLLSVTGKIWELGAGTITLIDERERTDFNYSLPLGGDFTKRVYAEIGRAVADLKINNQYERLPVVTLTCTVESAAGGPALKNCFLTEVKR